MSVRKLSNRYVNFLIGRALSQAIPGLRARMPYYDAVRLMTEAGQTETIRQFQQIEFDPDEAQFAAKLPDAPPDRVERSVSLVTLDNATLLGATGAIIDEARQELLIERGRRTSVSYHDFRPVLSSVVHKPDAAYFNMVGSHVGHRHYFHFMCDRLPRLFYLLKHFQLGRRPVTVLTNPDLPGFQRDIYRFIGELFPNIRYQAVPRNERWRMRRLFHIDQYQPAMRTLADPELLAFMRALIFDGFGIRPDPRGRRRIYVSRADTPLRRIVNEADILPVLSRHGFEIVAPGKLSLRDQAHLFNSAEVIVGAHGAGLTNILFAPRTAKVVEILPVTKLNSIYLLLAVSLGQTHRAVIGGVGGRKEWFKVNPAELENTLDVLASMPGKTRRALA